MVFKKITLYFAVLGIGLFAIALSFLFYIGSTLPSVDDIQDRRVLESTKIYDRTGEFLLYEVHGDERRTTITSDQIPQFVREAVIAIEDSSFYTNPAFDWRGILRAISIDILHGRVLQGGSTITQQLAKNSFLTPERNIVRKLKELVLAYRLEKKYTKNEILTLYLNQIPYGSNVYGVETASKMFFGKHASEITLNEAAILASVPKATTYYSPWGSHKDELLKRKDFVLTKMHELRFIDDEQFSSSLGKEPLFLSQAPAEIRAPHFVMYVNDYLNKKYGEEFVKTKGLRVQTTLDWDLQQLAEEAVRNGVKRNTELYGGTNGALVAEDPKTGQILSMVGSRDYFDSENEGNFNVAAQGLRQPGSTFKPFAYLTAFQKGFTPETIIWDAKTEFNTTDEKDESYSPVNNDEIFRGPVLLKEALAESINVPSVKVLYLAGIENTIRNAEKLGITTLKDRSRFGLSLVLGGGEVKLVELVGAYGVFATEGVRNAPTPILKIEYADGNILEEYSYEGEQVLEAQYPRLINDILSDIDLRSKLFQRSLHLTQVLGHQIALKTGTTNDFVDAWAIGYTPNIVVGVWAGNNHREPLRSKAGSVLAAVPIWHDFISKALKKYEPETFTRPEPTAPSNPILRGELPQGEPHDILYYLNRTSDSQFENWENGVREWLMVNKLDVVRFSLVGSLDVSSPNFKEVGEIKIDCSSPQNGSFVTAPLHILCSIESSDEIVKVDSYLNNEPLDSRAGNFPSSFFYEYSAPSIFLKQQNLITLKAMNSKGVEARRDFIVFN